MQEGWSAKELLKPLWQNYPGGRDKLATDVGLKSGNTLSSINSGKRNLGLDLGQRLAAKLGVSLLELGAPEGLADARGLTLLARLEWLAGKVADAIEGQVALERRVAALEAGRGHGGAAPTHQPAQETS